MSVVFTAVSALRFAAQQTPDFAPGRGRPAGVRQGPPAVRRDGRIRAAN